MKKKSYLSLCFLPLLFMIVALSPACKKNADASGAAPVVKSVRLYLASPNDVEISNGDPKTSGAIYSNGGVYVAIVGNNLKNATEIDFDGVPASINAAFISPNNAVVKLPIIDYTKVDTTKLYSLVYKTPGGSTTFWFKLGPLMPTISAISNVFANPGDSVYVYGTNLVLVQQFIYGGTKISSFKSVSDGSSLGFLMPAATPTTQIVITTKSGTAVDTIKATPTITRISNENASPGDSVYVYGTYLKNIQSLSYAGAAINSFKTSADLKFVAFVAPATSQSGPVSVTTKFGTGTTIYKVYTPTYLQNGVIENMEGGWSFNGMNGWWAAGSGGINKASNDPFGWLTHTTDFDGVLGTNNSIFIFLNTGILNSGDGAWYGGSGTRLSSNQWVPVANLNDAPGNWAIKLEISVAKGWNGGALDITTDAGGGYVYRWEPWKTGTAYKTKGWITLTIPLTSFRASDPTLGEGMGASINKITDLLGPTGNTAANIYVHNYDAAKTATGFYGAFDNIRIVKIK
ncbi:glycan-binding surface protein [Mucilaginibacter sp. AW1-7]|uniref:glycan-binding surface protein n=1 Tax=Mucilaginibacter sp. AW1-7 TaxID=3349874 RepID=UPI003F7417E4